MAHKKAGGSTRNGRDSESKRLGVKKYGGELVKAGIYYYKTAWDKNSSWRKCWLW